MVGKKDFKKYSDFTQIQINCFKINKKENAFMAVNERERFNKILQKNGIGCRKEPRTKEEMANLICIYNTTKDTIELKPKDYVLAEDEIFIPTEGLSKEYTSAASDGKTSDRKTAEGDELENI